MNHSIGEMIKIISEDMQKRRDNDLKVLGLTFSQLRALMIISKYSGEITQRELEEKLYVSHSATHGTIVRLEEKGLIKTESDETDKRNKRLLVTGIGQEKIDVLKNNRQNNPLPIDALSKEEKEELKRLLAIIVENIK